MWIDGLSSPERKFFLVLPYFFTHISATIDIISSNASLW